MDFKEEQNTIQIKKVKMKCDNQLANNFIPPFDSFHSGFCLSICGYSGSGKTNLMCNMLTNKKVNGKRQSFRNIFNDIFIFSPSLHTLQCKQIFDKLEHKFDELTEDNLEEIYDIIEQEQDEERTKQFLIIFDDVGNEIRKNKKIEEQFNKLISNRRHMNLSVMMLLQNVTQIQPKIRTNLSHLISFLPKSIEEEERIFAYSKKSKKYKEDFFKIFFREPFDFMFIDMSLKKSSSFIFYRNFNKITF